MNPKVRQKLREIFNKHDPIEIYVDEKTNADEYDPEISGLVVRFNRSKNKTAFQTEIHALFVKMFDERIAGPKSKYKKLADEVYEFLNEFK